MPRASVATSPAELYLVTNSVNGKRYIGVTAKGASARFKGHVSLAFNTKSTAYFHRAIRKHGPEQFSVEVLARFDVYPDALEAECKAIAELKPEYNITRGGDGAPGYRFSAEQRAHMSRARKGKVTRAKGWKHTPESLRKMSESSKGQPGYWKGRRLPEHVYDRLREANAARADWWAQTCLLGSKSQQRKTVCLDDGMVYESVTAAADAYGLDSSSVVEVCGKNGIRRTAGGKVFRYLGEHHGGKEEADRERQSVYERKYVLSRPQHGTYTKAVRCLDDGCYFPTTKAAAEHYGITSTVIKRICEGSRKPRKNIAGKGLNFEYIKDGLYGLE